MKRGTSAPSGNDLTQGEIGIDTQAGKIYIKNDADNYVEIGQSSGSSDSIDLDDNEKILLGTGDDLQLFHNNGHSFITNNTGDSDLYLQVRDGSTLKTPMRFDASNNAQIELGANTNSANHSHTAVKYSSHGSSSGPALEKIGTTSSGQLANFASSSAIGTYISLHGSTYFDAALDFKYNYGASAIMNGTKSGFSFSNNIIYPAKTNMQGFLDSGGTQDLGTSVYQFDNIFQNNIYAKGSNYSSPKIGYVARAWASFSTGGTPSMQNSDGFSSITDVTSGFNSDTTGRVRFTLSSGPGSTSYCPIVSYGDADLGSSHTNVSAANVTNKNYTTFDVQCENLDGSFIEGDQCGVVVFY